jgi:hypothetical protein
MFGILKSFKLSERRGSYKEFMTLMFHVYLYNNTKTEKNIKTQNNKQKAKLPLFLIRFFT